MQAVVPRVMRTELSRLVQHESVATGFICRRCTGPRRRLAQVLARILAGHMALANSVFLTEHHPLLWRLNRKRYLQAALGAAGGVKSSATSHTLHATY